MRDFNKVFVISLPRHGTTSMFNALGKLGIHISHLGKIYGEASGDNFNSQRISRIAEQTKQEDFQYDILKECSGMSDVPTSIVFEALDSEYPNSLFIHITRPMEDWLYSYKRMSLGMDLSQESNSDQRLIKALTYFRKSFFGVEHFKRASAYFDSDNSRLLEVALENLTSEKGYEILCDFLECEKPDAHFPRSNEHSYEPVRLYGASYEN